MDKQFSFLSDLDELVTDLQLGLSNLGAVQTALAEGVISSADGGQAIHCTWAYLHGVVEKMQNATNTAFQEMGVRV